MKSRASKRANLLSFRIMSCLLKSPWFPITAQVGFILLLSGFVVYEILSEWPVSKAILTWIPDRLVDAMGITGPMTGFVSAVVMFIVFPAVFFGVVATLAGIASGRQTEPFGPTVKTFALLLLPTMAGAHIIKAALKMTPRIPYWSHVFADPKGVDTARRITNGTLVLNTSVPEALDPIVSATAAVILVIVLASTIWIFRRSASIKKLDSAARIVLLLGVLVYWGIFGLMIFRWRFS